MRSKKMYRLINLIVLLGFFLISLLVTRIYAENSSDNSMFYDTLSSYGQWVDMPDYGSVFIPNDLPGSWQPYTNGYWIYSYYGWFWSSYFEWGDICFHYGRWFYSAPWGWYWIPGGTWGPAWVSWYYVGDYIGWMPLPPDNFFGNSDNGFQSGFQYWVFVPVSNFTDPDMKNDIVSTESIKLKMQATDSADSLPKYGDKVLSTPPKVSFVQKAINKEIIPYQIKKESVPVPPSLKITGTTLHVFYPGLSMKNAVPTPTYIAPITSSTENETTKKEEKPKSGIKSKQKK
ncbi:MAG: hypothetical protein A2161_02010 [Candidatus Schekmanbacteria bacterium RBG_13_48_7]|uniref:Uncharacterized protein n=1 Tax=Candidatus Schekmanbacteria bacterium RBG_13_48_7 TaxID=1817878 RepID=A0A1F7RXX0_9BACT|nr:MAG: hypothetical protein A2161_02010 [Candidatus Schekmanbacteria bacterium RBG_13_48_7]